MTDIARQKRPSSSWGRTLSFILPAANRLSFLVFRRGNAVVLSECTRKAELIRIPYRPCRLSRTHMLVKKHRSRILHPAANQVLLRRTSHLFFKQRAEIAALQMCVIRKLLYGELLHIVGLNTELSTSYKKA